MKLHVEVFFVKLEDENAVYFRDFLDLSYKSQDPDVYVKQKVEEHAQALKAGHDDCIIHSTSWRCDHSNLVVLTYIVYSDSFIFPKGKAKKIAIENLKIATSEDINKPKPVEIAEKNIVSHGLRHVSFLIKHDEVFKKRVIFGTKETFKKIDRVLAEKV